MSNYEIVESFALDESIPAPYGDEGKAVLIRSLPRSVIRSYKAKLNEMVRRDKSGELAMNDDGDVIPNADCLTAPDEANEILMVNSVVNSSGALIFKDAGDIPNYLFEIVGKIQIYNGLVSQKEVDELSEAEKLEKKSTKTEKSD